MNLQLAKFFQRKDKKTLWLGISAILLLLILLGSVLLRMAFQPRASCAGCEAPDPNIYVTSFPTFSGNSSSSAFLYTLNAHTGNPQHTVELKGMDAGHFDIFYQKILNGVSYMLSEPELSMDSSETLSATRLSDDKLLWTYNPGSYAIGDGIVGNSTIIASSTMFYLPIIDSGNYGSNSHAPLPTGVVAIDMQSGQVAWKYMFPLAKVDGYAEITPVLYLDGNTIFALTPGDNIFALDAETGTELWKHIFHDSNANDLIAPVADGNHLFLATQPDQPPSHVFEFDLSTGSLLWQGKLAAGNGVSFLDVINHCLLIEMQNLALYVLRDTNISLLWSYTPQNLNQSHESQWIYTSDIIYGLFDTIDPHTFARRFVLAAWRVPQSKMLFQTTVDLTGTFDIAYIQNYLVLTSFHSADSDQPIQNDVEVLQGDTGKLLWHKKVGKLPPFNNGNWSLLFLASGALQSDAGYTSFYIPDHGTQNQSILFFDNYLYPADNGMTTNSTVLYAIDIHNGQLLWQDDIDQFNNDALFHLTPTPIAPVTYVTPKSDRDFTNFAGTWEKHKGTLTFAANGKATTTLYCNMNPGCPDKGYTTTTFQFTRVKGNTAYGTTISTNDTTYGFNPGQAITAQVNTDGTLAFYSASQLLAVFCDAQAFSESLCGA